MRQKHRYMLIHFTCSDPMDLIKNKYMERFGESELHGLRMISQQDSFLVIKCNLEYYLRLREIFPLGEECVSLSASGTLRSLRSRMQKKRQQFMGRDINAVKQKLTSG